MALYTNYGQVLYTTANRETGYVISKIPPSIYIPLKTDMLGYTSQDHSYQLSPTIQLLKGQPLD
jgi:hypothetical protein